MEDDRHPTKTAETAEVEYLGREVEYLGHKTKTSAHNDEDNDIEYMGYSIPAQLAAGTYWLKGRSGQWERWVVPQVSQTSYTIDIVFNCH